MVPVMIEYRILPDLGLTRTAWSGTVDDAELLEVYDRLFHDPQFRPGLHELADLRETTNLRGITGRGLRSLVRLAERAGGDSGSGSRTAILVRAEAAYGIGRMYEAYTYGSTDNVDVFRDPAEALAYVDAPADLLEDGDLAIRRAGAAAGPLPRPDASNGDEPG